MVDNYEPLTIVETWPLLAVIVVLLLRSHNSMHARVACHIELNESATCS